MVEWIKLKNRRESNDCIISLLCLALAIFLPFSSWSIEPFPFPFILFSSMSVAILLPMFYYLWFRRPRWVAISDEGVQLNYKKRTYQLTWEQIDIRHTFDSESGSDAYTIDWRGSPAWFSLPISSEVYFALFDRGEKMGYEMLEPNPRSSITVKK